VIGGGVAGYVAAIKASQSGLKVRNEKMLMQLRFQSEQLC
jgi:pyruvate/2-oxoglutarate dehydrogenase complex dihydrolipoamide dehydrogenase (E3) component